MMMQCQEEKRPRWYLSEDWLAVWAGALVLCVCFGAARVYVAAVGEGAVNARGGVEHPLSSYLVKPAKWDWDPVGSLVTADDFRHGGVSYLSVAVVALLLFGGGVWLRGESWWAFGLGFVPVFLVAAIALTLAAQEEIKALNLEYALWALGFGLLISNTVGTPRFVRPALRTEFYIKTGLVLLGAKILFSKLMYLGPRGLAVAWVVTPVVLVTTLLVWATRLAHSVEVAEHGDQR